MAFDMSTLMPGMNPSGTNQSTGGGVPGAPGAQAIGGNTNPLLPTFASGQSMPANSNSLYGGGGGGPSGIFNFGSGGGGAVPASTNMGGTGSAPNPAGGGGGNDINALISQILSGGFPANGVAAGGINAPGTIPGGGGGASSGGFNLAQSLGLGSGDPNAAHNFVKAMRKAGFSSGVAGQLWNFINSGAGFNQGAINNLLQSTFAAQQPQIARGEADLVERYGAMGLGMSSPAAIGLGDYLSQVSLGQGEIAAQTEYTAYNQAVQNYLSVLMGGKGQPPQNMFQNVMQWLQTTGNIAKETATATPVS